MVRDCIAANYYNFPMSRIMLLASVLIASAAFAQTTPAPFNFQTQSLPSGAIGRQYTETVLITGGTIPLAFSVRGKLPPGLTLQPNSGIIAGTPTAPGSYRFTITVEDGTHKRITRQYTINIEDLLTIKWLQQPRLNSNVLSGSVEVLNSSRDTYDLTVIIVAVNEIGKAFALGYQHFDLGVQIRQPIPFSSTLPNGQYIVHADAVAEIPARNIIRRTRLQTPQPLTVNVNR
jgi:hypothetical protein